MFLLPFHDFVDGELTLIALGNKDMNNNPLHIHRIEISAAEPILFELLVTSESNLEKGEDIKDLVVSSRIGRAADYQAFEITAEPEIIDLDEAQVLKNKIAKYEATLLDETDGLSLDPKAFIVFRITSEEPTEFAGNILWQYLT